MRRSTPSTGRSGRSGSPACSSTSTIVAPDLVKILSKAEQLERLLLTTGALTVAEIMGELGVSDSHVRSILTKDHGRRFTRLEDRRIAAVTNQ